eukprot:6211842-Pleurochrysis_carterae.AAC.2
MRARPSRARARCSAPTSSDAHVYQERLKAVCQGHNYVAAPKCTIGRVWSRARVKARGEKRAHCGSTRECELPTELKRACAQQHE